MLDDETTAQVHEARVIVRRLRAAKSDRLWTAEECNLLQELCAVLGVPDEPGAPSAAHDEGYDARFIQIASAVKTAIREIREGYAHLALRRLEAAYNGNPFPADDEPEGA